MSPSEMAGRARDELTRRRWRARQVSDAGTDPAAVPAACPPFAALLPEADDGIPEDARVRLKEAAEGLLAGRWQVFACERGDMAPAPDWFLDPSTGVRAPGRAYCFDIDHRDQAAVGNVKYVWEPSRHQHLTVLAAAYHVTGEERYAEAVATQLRSWWAANPFLSGIHWTSGIELGVRLLSWVWIRRLLHGWAGAGPLFEGNHAFLRQLHHHQEWLARLPSHGSSANNHILAEMAGSSLRCAFPWFPEAPAGEAAAGTLRRELATETFAGGLNRELATEYHGLVLELGLAAALQGERAGRPLGRDVWDTLRRMMDALAAIVGDACAHPARATPTTATACCWTATPGVAAGHRCDPLRAPPLVAGRARERARAPPVPDAARHPAAPAAAARVRRPSRSDAGMALGRPARRAVVPGRPRPARVPVDRRPCARRRPRGRAPGRRRRHSRRPGDLLLRRGTGRAPPMPTAPLRSGGSGPVGRGRPPSRTGPSEHALGSTAARLPSGGGRPPCYRRLARPPSTAAASGWTGGGGGWSSRTGSNPRA